MHKSKNGLNFYPQSVSTCYLCNSAFETRDHLFFECSFAGELWRGTLKIWQVEESLLFGISYCKDWWWVSPTNFPPFFFDTVSKQLPMLYGVREIGVVWENLLNHPLVLSSF